MEADGKSCKDIGAAAGADPTTVRRWFRKRHAQADALLAQIPQSDPEMRFRLLGEALVIGPSKRALEETLAIGPSRRALDEALEGFRTHNPANHLGAAALVAGGRKGRHKMTARDPSVMPTGQMRCSMREALQQHEEGSMGIRAGDIRRRPASHR